MNKQTVTVKKATQAQTKAFWEAGSSLRGYVSLTFREIEALAGPVGNGDKEADKSAFNILLHAERLDKTFCLYEYKETSVYADDLPSPAAFKKAHLDKPFRFHIGGKQIDLEFLALELSRAIGRKVEIN